MERAILQTVAYVDMYDYPLTAPEIHRYLIGLKATRPEVERALGESRLTNSSLEAKDGYYFLAGRGHIVGIRRRRAQASEQLWPHAWKYGRLASALPYVSMVAVTGSLAVDNVDARADIDFLIVTDIGRLWLCRAMVILLVRRAARQGISLCPNYFLSERALVFDERNLYTAHEIVQMIPIAGMKVYRRLLDANRWLLDILPNSNAASDPVANPANTLSLPVRGARRLGELVLRTPPGTWLEGWEMNRKVRRFSQETASEAAFSADYCKGHFDGHSYQALDEFNHQWEKLVAQAQEELTE